MIKVMWLLKKAEHLSLTEFSEWWLESHARVLADVQSPHLLRYVVNVRYEQDDFIGKPPTASEWDGIAEQWFADEGAFIAAYSTSSAPLTREDTKRHTSKLERIVVREFPIALGETA